jgi:hypothetical protein
MPRTASLVTIATLAALPAAPAALAHHSFFGRFDASAITELEGEVVELLWRNPHVSFTLRVADDAGAAVDWEIETSSLTVLKRMGIEAGVFKVGDRLRVAGNPPAGAKKELYARHVLLPDGRELLLNVGLTARWSSEALGDESLLMARTGDGSRPELGIFRVWSHTRAEPRLFPEATDPTFDVRSYPLTEAARTALDEFDRATDNPTANCVPKGMPTIMEAPYPIEFVQELDGNIVLKLEEYDLERRIRTSRGPPAEPPAPSPLGYSVGRWEGRTLAVATSRINWPYFSQLGIPQSPNVAIVERFTPSEDGSRLDYEMTVVDPATFTRPVVLRQYWLYLPDVRLMPYLCTAR